MLIPSLSQLIHDIIVIFVAMVVISITEFIIHLDHLFYIILIYVLANQSVQFEYFQK